MYFDQHEFPLVGGLMSYGPSFAEAYRHAGVYAAKSLRVRNRPIFPSSNLPTSISSSTSRLPRRSASTVPPTLLARADEVIE